MGSTCFKKNKKILKIKELKKKNKISLNIYEKLEEKEKKEVNIENKIEKNLNYD